MARRPESERTKFFGLSKNKLTSPELVARTEKFITRHDLTEEVEWVKKTQSMVDEPVVGIVFHLISYRLFNDRYDHEAHKLRKNFNRLVTRFAGHLCNGDNGQVVGFWS